MSATMILFYNNNSTSLNFDDIIIIKISFSIAVLFAFSTLCLDKIPQENAVLHRLNLHIFFNVQVENCNFHK